MLFLGGLTSQVKRSGDVVFRWLSVPVQHVARFLHKLMCCHTESVAAGQACYLTKSQHTEVGPASPSTDLSRPGTQQDNH